MGYARRKDATHNTIVEALEAAGCRVVDLSGCGRGVPDAFVWQPSTGRWWFAEIKSPGGKPNDRQKKFKEQGWPIIYPESVEEALKVLR